MSTQTVHDRAFFAYTNWSPLLVNMICGDSVKFELLETYGKTSGRPRKAGWEEDMAEQPMQSLGWSPCAKRSKLYLQPQSPTKEQVMTPKQTQGMTLEQ